MMKTLLKDPTLLKTQAFIAGEWVDANNKKTFAVNNPATGEHIIDVASVGEEETRRAIGAAQHALFNWKKLPAKDRSQVLERWHDLVVEHAEDLAIIMTLEQGKVLAESRAEIGYGASFIKWFAEEAKRIYGDVIPNTTTDRRSLVIKQAVGVVAAITPWNFPNAMITRKAAPALAAGCSIVLKPASETPLSALALAELADRAGIAPGLFNVLPGENSAEIGGELTSNPIVKKLTFTGSTPIGKLLMNQCAATVKRTSMELGGNAPVIIFDDANLDLAVAGAIASKFRNSGQTCICANRLLVQDTIYDKFVEKLSQEIQSFTLGNGLDNNSTHGPLITQKAVSDVHAKVQAAISSGAESIVSNIPDVQAGNFYPPTILTNVNPEMAIFKEEIFGPVAPIFRFSNEEEAITMANNTEFGLAAYLYTENMGRIWRVSESIDYGMVGVNETAISSEVIPFGGVKESGQGREGSKYGLEDYLEVKYICIGGLN